MTLNEIRNDFMDIRYYYARKHIFDEALRIVGKNTIEAKAMIYNQAAKALPPNLFDIYFTLYIKGLTQDALAKELGYTIQHVNRLNKKILLFMQKTITEKGETT